MAFCFDAVYYLLNSVVLCEKCAYKNKCFNLCEKIEIHKTSLNQFFEHKKCHKCEEPLSIQYNHSAGYCDRCTDFLNIQFHIESEDTKRFESEDTERCCCDICRIRYE